ncbi:MAG: hypothetical protein V1893_03110 [Candidatus Omnitrophota bacterium]
MKRICLIMCMIIVCTPGCCLNQPPPKEKSVALATVNNYVITYQEFEEEFKDSAYGTDDTVESKKEFLSHLINRKLILQDAQKNGLDKDKDFLKMIEKFWEQSLLKLALDRKAKEVVGSVSVSDQEIEEAYNKMQKEGKTAKTLQQVYGQIKWELISQKESQSMDDWLTQLHKKATITTNEELLTRDNK